MLAVIVVAEVIFMLAVAREVAFMLVVAREVEFQPISVDKVILKSDLQALVEQSPKYLRR